MLELGQKSMSDLLMLSCYRHRDPCISNRLHGHCPDQNGSLHLGSDRVPRLRNQRLNHKIYVIERGFPL